MSDITRFAIIAAGLSITVAALGTIAYALALSGQTTEVGASLSLSDALSVSAANFKSVTTAKPLTFPEDHGAHPEYAIEWWYYTGNLDTAAGRHFGYELTFFRTGLTANESQRSSKWAAQNIYYAHFALTDVENEDFYAFERSSRDALGLAGVTAAPFRVWLENWSVASVGDSTLPMRLHVMEEDAGIEIELLLLYGGKDTVLHGEDGFSRKSSSSDTASYYYSITRMPTRGTVTINGESHTVSGASWLDREWSSNRLSDEHIGWDWFALQLSDGRDIMYGILRPREDSGNAFRLGTIVAANGEYKSIEAHNEVRITVLDEWQSPLGGIYPSGWRFQILTEGLDLEITPYIRNQELDTVVRYWEGAVRIEGTSNGQPISGSGYVELTGYAD